MIATIQERIFYETKRKDRIYSWMTRNICTATTLDIARSESKDGSDPIFDWINTLTLDPQELEELQKKKEEPVQPKALNDEVGSMERLIGMFSNPMMG